MGQEVKTWQDEVLERFDAALKPIYGHDGDSSHYTVPIEVTDALATILRQQAAQLAEAQAALEVQRDIAAQALRMLEQRWVSVRERLPEENRDVLVSVGKGVQQAVLLGTQFYASSYPAPLKATHWQPLPAPPAQGASDGE